MKTALIPVTVVLVTATAMQGGESWLECPDDAIQYLQDCLRADSASYDGLLETAFFTVEWLDDLPDSTARDYSDIAIRELHNPVTSGTVDSLRLIDRFRVYANGRILYSSPIFGYLIPYEDFLEGRADI